MLYLMAVMILASVVQAWCLWRVRARLAGLSRLEERLASVPRTLLLLTDTMEAGFQTLGSPRPGEPEWRVSGARMQRRVVGAASRGRSPREIAAAEELAEGEVHLRLHLAKQDQRLER
jgi:hypothetical protein